MPRFFKTLIILVLAACPLALAQSPHQQGLPQMFMTSDTCMACHNGLSTSSGRDVSIGTGWESSMMAHSSKDPYWQASVRREIMDHPLARQAIEDECAACHMPMSRYRANAIGRKGNVFGQLPTSPIQKRMDRLAADGVSCSMCHQIQPDKLGSAESFTAGFVVNTVKPPGQRPAFGPYEVDVGRSRVMRSAARLEPTQSKHIQESALCGSCHTLYTHTRGPDGDVIGTLPEQMPFLEWRHSSYADRQSCQNCHMPTLKEKTEITSVLPQARAGFSKHVFRGGNFFMPKVFNRYRNALGVTALPGALAETSRQTAENLRTDSGRIGIVNTRAADDNLEVTVMVANMTGHKLPTAYPSRRAWIHFSVSDRTGRTVFESGALKPDGSIIGNDNDRDRRQYEPHYENIDDPGQVQIYEAIMVDPLDRVTTGLLSAIRFIKDNRILPNGFDKHDAGDDIAVQGAAYEDADFTGMGDTVGYRVSVDPSEGPFTVRAELWYQPIAFRWAHNLLQQDAEETRRFVDFYDSLSESSGMVLDRDMKTVSAGNRRTGK